MIPLSPLMGLGTFAMKAMFQIWAKKQEIERDRQIRSMASYNAEEESKQRAANLTDKKVSFTRRTGFILLTLAIIAPIFAPIFGVDSAVMYKEIDPGFWFWSENTEITRIERFGVGNAVMVVPPLVFDLYAMMVGYYFGGKVGK